jgi:hypothetical protein
MKKRIMIMAIVAVFSSMALGATINYSEDFTYWNWDTLVPSSVSGVNADSRYWYTYTDNTVFGGVTWSGAPYYKWMLNINQVVDGFSYKNFRLDGTLAADETFTGATAQAYMQNATGLDYSEGLSSKVGIFDESGNGYYGNITRAGTMIIYRLDNGISTLLSENSSGDVPDGNGKTLRLNIENGVVTLSMYYPADETTIYSLTANDTTYDEFTTLALGGYYGYNEQLGIDNIAMTATIVPEPATLTLAMLGLCGWTAIRRNRK